MPTIYAYFAITLIFLPLLSDRQQPEHPPSASVERSDTTDFSQSAKASVIEMNLDDIKLDDLRSAPMSQAIPLAASQQQHFLDAVYSTTRLLQKFSTLETAEIILGHGEFFWPKDPRKPDQILRFYRTFAIDGMRLQLERTKKRFAMDGGNIYYHSAKPSSRNVPI